MKMKSFLLGCMIVLLSACSGTPSESSMAEQIESGMNQAVGFEFVEVKNLKKINGIQESDSSYLAQLEFDLYFPKSIEQVVAPLGGRMQREMAGFKLGATVGGAFAADDTRHRAVNYRFAKSENGWVLATKNFLVGDR